MGRLSCHIVGCFVFIFYDNIRKFYYFQQYEEKRKQYEIEIYILARYHHVSASYRNSFYEFTFAHFILLLQYHCSELCIRRFSYFRNYTISASFIFCIAGGFKAFESGQLAKKIRKKGSSSSKSSKTLHHYPKNKVNWLHRLHNFIVINGRAAAVSVCSVVSTTDVSRICHRKASTLLSTCIT